MYTTERHLSTGLELGVGELVADDGAEDGALEQRVAALKTEGEGVVILDMEGVGGRWGGRGGGGGLTLGHGAQG